MKRNIIVIALVILLAGVAIYQNAQRENKETLMPTEQAAKVNFLAPSFTLKGLDGKDYTIGGPREKPLLVNFWASWCGPCEEEAPDLVNVYNKYQGQFELYAVNVTPGDKMENITKFVETYKFPFPVLLDKQGTNADTYRVVAIPTSFLIDRNGVIREVIHVLSPRDLDKKIANLIKG